MRHMFITKKHLSRRTRTEGRGSHDRAAAARCDDSRRRRRWAQTPRGKTPHRRWRSSASRWVPVDEAWSPEQTGTDFKMPPILEAARKVPRLPDDRLVACATSPPRAPSHTRYIERTWLVVLGGQMRAWSAPTPASRPTSSRRATWVRTRATVARARARRCAARKSPGALPKQSLPQEGNPRAVFYRLFGQGDTDAERQAIVARKRAACSTA